MAVFGVCFAKSPGSATAVLVHKQFSCK